MPTDVLPDEFVYPVELKDCGFDLTIAMWSVDLRGGSCRIPHARMESVKELFRRVGIEGSQSLISNIDFGSYFPPLYSAEDGSITLRPRTIIVAGDELLESDIEIDYNYPKLSSNPVY